MILAGDIGGTNCRLAIVAPDGRRILHEAVIASRDHTSLESAIHAFIGALPLKKPKISAATLGIAGPVIVGRVQATNLPWSVDQRVLAKKLGIARVTLLNDLVCLALGALTVPRSKLKLLQGDTLPGTSSANVAVIAAGTGLGEAALIWDGERLIPCGSEGGHTDFAPCDAIEAELLVFLKERFAGHVSYERIVSGPGIGNLYDFFREAKAVAEQPEHAAAITAAPDRNATITELGISGKSSPAASAVELFASIYGAEAGNLALKTLATGGVFVAGGIAAHLKDFLANSPFVPSFLAKGRMRPLLEKIPVAVVLDAKIGLAGAAHHAALQGK